MQFLFQDSAIIVYFSNRSSGYSHVIGSAYSKDVSYEIQCSDIAAAGVNRTVEDALDVT